MTCLHLAPHPGSAALGEIGVQEGRDAGSLPAACQGGSGTSP